MPKRRCSERDGAAPTAEPRRRRRRLYLIFDDWSNGYSIREVNLPSGSSHQLSAVSGAAAEQRLPPPFLRLEVPRPRALPPYFACAFDSRIFATHPKNLGFEGACEYSSVILDVRKRSLMLGPAQYLPLCPIYIPVGDRKLFSLHSDYMEMLCRSPREQPPSVDGKDTDWSWCNLRVSPFDTMYVTSYAVHPAGPSILVSIKSDDDDDDDDDDDTSYAISATFSFHTEELVWKQLGEWTLPFTGRGHYDKDLEILVGLSKDPETLGYLCFCGVNSLNTSSNTRCPAPAWKLCQEKLFSVNPGEQHVSATLIYMGSKSKFCLVECIFFTDVRAAEVLEEGSQRRPNHYMYRLMKFSLRFDRNGDLKTRSRRVRYFNVPKTATIEFLYGGPLAFLL